MHAFQDNIFACSKQLLPTTAAEHESVGKRSTCARRRHCRNRHAGMARIFPNMRLTRALPKLDPRPRPFPCKTNTRNDYGTIKTTIRERMDMHSARTQLRHTIISAQERAFIARTSRANVPRAKNLAPLSSAGSADPSDGTGLSTPPCHVTADTGYVASAVAIGLCGPPPSPFRYFHPVVCRSNEVRWI